MEIDRNRLGRASLVDLNSCLLAIVYGLDRRHPGKESSATLTKKTSGEDKGVTFHSDKSKPIDVAKRLAGSSSGYLYTRRARDHEASR
jgi:hypothetical protein